MTREEIIRSDLSPVAARALRYPQEAEIIGQVVGVAIRLGDWRPLLIFQQARKRVKINEMGGAEPAPGPGGKYFGRGCESFHEAAGETPATSLDCSAISYEFRIGIARTLESSERCARASAFSAPPSLRRHGKTPVEVASLSVPQPDKKQTPAGSDSQ